MNDLTPTLWKTCRTLANKNRLNCLREVFKKPGLNVTQLARCLEVPDNHASLILRALQSRGLIRPVRHSRWVYYHPIPDPLVRSSGPIMFAMRKVLLREDKPESAIIHVLTAFTHSRRLAILAYLKLHKEQSVDVLSYSLSISRQALYRHLRKLEVRGFVRQTAGLYSLIARNDALGRTLLRLLTTNDNTS